MRPNGSVDSILERCDGHASLAAGIDQRTGETRQR